MQTIFWTGVSIILLVPLCAANNQLKCYQCVDCGTTGKNLPVSKSCMLLREDRCLKFVGVDKGMNETKIVVHRQCSSPSGCDYFHNLSNFTVHFCDTCTAQLCNGTQGKTASPLILLLGLALFTHIEWI